MNTLSQCGTVGPQVGSSPDLLYNSMLVNDGGFPMVGNAGYTEIYCTTRNKRTSVSMNVKLALDPKPIHPSFKSKLTGQFYGSGLLSETMFDLFLVESCGGIGYQTQQLAVPMARDSIFFAAYFTLSPDEVMNYGNPLSFELRADDDGELLACCQWQA